MSDKPAPHVSAQRNLGPHLLGRIPNTPDDRDWSKEKLEYHLSTFTDATADKTIRQLHDDGSLNSWSAILLLWRWIKSFWPKPAPTPTPPGPVPVPPSPVPGGATKEWADARQLDQGQTGHCVGFGCAQWGNTAPIEDALANADGHAIYYEAKIIDGEPGAENGSQVRSGVKALQKRKRLAAYAFGQGSGTAVVAEIVDWVLNHGPAILGSNWYTGFFSPDSNGLVKLTGVVEGGHCFIVLGVVQPSWSTKRLFECQNSWGDWGANGRFYISESDVARLMDEQGDACFAAEIP